MHEICFIWKNLVLLFEINQLICFGAGTDLFSQAEHGWTRKLLRIVTKTRTILGDRVVFSVNLQDWVKDIHPPCMDLHWTRSKFGIAVLLSLEKFCGRSKKNIVQGLFTLWSFQCQGRKWIILLGLEFCKGARQSGLVSVWQHTLGG